MQLHIVTEADGRVVAVHPVRGHGQDAVPGAKAAGIVADADRVLHDLDMPDEEYSRLRSQEFLRGPVYLDIAKPGFVLRQP